jgi:hypothetical protein
MAIYSKISIVILIEFTQITETISVNKNCIVRNITARALGAQTKNYIFFFRNKFAYQMIFRNQKNGVPNYNRFLFQGNVLKVSRVRENIYIVSSIVLIRIFLHHFYS